MKLFDKHGILIIPVPEKKSTAVREIILVKSCYCQHGHNLVSSQAKFGEHQGIVLGIGRRKKKSLIALSPVYGDKSRISLGEPLKEGEILQLLCPECKAELPSYARCECGGDLIVMFTHPEVDYRNCVGVCNRVGCKHAEIKNEGQLMTLITGE